MNRLTGSPFARGLANIQQSIELRIGWKYMLANGRTPSGPMETGCRGKSISDSPRVSS